MNWKGYTLNLIDTPGHVDFSYEVSRSLQAVEIAVLVVDATQGIQAQTLANVYLALEQNLRIIPVINKIDLPAADIEKTAAEIMNLLGCEREEIIEASGKTGYNVDKILDAVVEIEPKLFSNVTRGEKLSESNDEIENFIGDNFSPVALRLYSSKSLGSISTRALIFDSYFDDYRGVVLYVRIFEGEISKNAEILMMAAEKKGIALEVGILTPKMTPREKLLEGEIGYIVTKIGRAHV